MAAIDTFKGKPSAWPRLQARPRMLFWIGCAMTLLGSIAVASPAFGPLVIGAFAGWLLWLAGAVMFGASLLLFGARPFVAGAVSSLMAIGAGMFLLFNPMAGALAVVILAVAAFIADGAFQLALALDLRPLKVWRWVLVSALSSAVAALMMGAGFVDGSIIGLGPLVGVALLTTGAAFFALGAAAAGADRAG